MSVEEDMRVVREQLKFGWPEELKEKVEKHWRPVPPVFQRVIADYCSTLAKISGKKWNAFCIAGNASEVMSGDTHQTVVEELYRFLFPRKKYPKEHSDMLRECSEEMLDRDEVYFELFFHCKA